MDIRATKRLQVLERALSRGGLAWPVEPTRAGPWYHHHAIGLRTACGARVRHWWSCGDVPVETEMCPRCLRSTETHAEGTKGGREVSSDGRD